MIEMVPMAFRIADDLSHPPSYESTLLLDGENGGGGAGKKMKGSLEGNGGGKGKGSLEGSTDGVSGIGGSANGEEEEEGRREMVRRRLEGVGYRVGLGIVERLVYAPFPLRRREGRISPVAERKRVRDAYLYSPTHKCARRVRVYLQAHATGMTAGEATDQQAHMADFPGLLEQLLPRPAPLRRHARHDQVPVQGRLDARLPQADR